MNLIKLVISIQMSLAFVCLCIQIYALASPKWAIFESRVELGIIEEHGHYGLWSICTSKLIPAEVAEDGHVLVGDVADCEPMNTFFKPAHSRIFIATFCLAHGMAVLAFTCLLMMRLIEIMMQDSNKRNNADDGDANDLETNQSRAKRLAVIATRFIRRAKPRYRRDHSSPSSSSSSPNNGDCCLEEEAVKRQIRIKLYTISVAAATTSFALLAAITPRRPLRESDAFQINNVSATNYRVWRGAAFWAQLTTLIMDMLVTSLIAIEVRVLFVLQQQQQQQQLPQSNRSNVQITTTCGTSDNVDPDPTAAAAAGSSSSANMRLFQQEQSQREVIINPFFQADSLPIISHTRIGDNGVGGGSSSSSRSNNQSHHFSMQNRKHRKFANTTATIPKSGGGTHILISDSDNVGTSYLIENLPNNVQHEPQQQQQQTFESNQTQPKSVINTGGRESASINNHYINSREVRQLKKATKSGSPQQLQQQPQPQQTSDSANNNRGTRIELPVIAATSYCNPMFIENDIHHRDTPIDGPNNNNNNSSSSEC